MIEPALQLRRAIRRLDEKQLDRLVKFIDENIGANVSVARLAAQIGMSPSHFSYCFKQSLGISPYVFITRRKMVAAARLLIETEGSLEVIAERIGFSNLGHFRRQFRKSFGCNPSHLRMVAGWPATENSAKPNTVAGPAQPFR